MEKVKLVKNEMPKRGVFKSFKELQTLIKSKL
jgi:hypothetical protein